jgi:type II secretory pathway pseudopilin PulG
MTRLVTARELLPSVRATVRLLRRDERGITLSEMIVVLVMLAVLIPALTTMLVSGANAEADLNLRFQAQQEARVALDTFRSEVHNACDATVSGATVTLKTQAGYACTVTNSTWCVLGTAPRFALYRQPGASCSTAGVKWADYLTSNAVFGVVTGAGLLKKVSVNLPVNRKPSVPRLQYRLQDAIVLRNGARG